VDLNDPTTVTLLAARALAVHGHDYALYGGLLTAVYGEPRETRDADLAVIDVSATDAQAAMTAAGLETLIAFERVSFEGLLLSRLTVLASASDTGLNTIDLVTPRSTRYARVAVERAVVSSMRDAPIRVLTLEDFIVFKVLSTRDRDLEDARAAMRRSGHALDARLLDREISALAAELPDVDVAGRWTAVQRRK
jgi:hypothetical protein